MSMARIFLKDLTDLQELELPCGVKTLSIAPKGDTSSFDFEYTDGSQGNYGVKHTFSYDYPQPLRSPKDNPLRIVAHGELHIQFTT